MNEYDYAKLKGRIRECFVTQSEFAQKLKISDTSLSNKLNNKTVFDQDEIKESIDIFNLNPVETMEYFFTKKVDKKSTK
jgi:hypothetical protein